MTIFHVEYLNCSGYTSAAIRLGFGGSAVDSSPTPSVIAAGKWQLCIYFVHYHLPRARMYCTQLLNQEQKDQQWQLTSLSNKIPYKLRHRLTNAREADQVSTKSNYRTLMYPISRGGRKGFSQLVSISPALGGLGE